MKVNYHIPNKKIADFVQDILVMEDVQVTAPFVLPLFANGTPTLLFQTVKGKIKGSSNNLTLFGQTVFPETLTLEEDFTLIAYFFKPFALFSLFGLSARELTDYPIDLNLLEPSKRLDLQEQLLNAALVEDMMALMDNYIFSLTQKVKSEIYLIKYATTNLAKNPSEQTLKAVQNTLCVTERSFQRMFKKHIGIPPDKFRRISQFSSAFKQLQHKRFKNLSDIAYDHGYADQSHFIRSFREFTNITPSEYLGFEVPA